MQEGSTELRAAKLPHLLVTFFAFLVFFGQIGIAMVVAVSARAAAETPSEFVQRLGRDAIGALTDTTRSRDEGMAVFRRILLEGFDVPGMGRFVLGRYWRVATPAEREEYLPLFEALTVRNFADVVVEGISEVQTQRNAFASIIHCAGGRIEGLLEKLREGTAASAFC